MTVDVDAVRKALDEALEAWKREQAVRDAAFELLEAVKAMRDECIGFVPKCADQVDAAIAKAEGRK